MKMFPVYKGSTPVFTGKPLEAGEVEMEDLYSPMTYREFMLSRLNPKGHNLDNGALGLASEAGEVAGLLKKHLYQDKPFDRRRFIDELSDVRYYYELMLHLLDATDDEVIIYNINKLTNRHPNGYNPKA